MEEVTTGTGPRVPAVKPGSKPFFYDEVPPPLEATASATAAAAVAEVAEVDTDLLCPICMQIIKNAFLTYCAHSFCFMCIITHLRNKSDCHCCSQFLTDNQLFPIFLLDKLIIIRFLCATFVAIEEDFSSSNIKNCTPCGTVSSGITTGL